MLQKLSTLIGQLATVHICDWLTKVKQIYDLSCLLVHAHPPPQGKILPVMTIDLALTCIRHLVSIDLDNIPSAKDSQTSPPSFK